MEKEAGWRLLSLVLPILLLLLLLLGRSLIVFRMGIISKGAAGEASHSQPFLVQVLRTLEFGHVNRSFLAGLSIPCHTMTGATHPLLARDVKGGNERYTYGRTAKAGDGEWTDA